MKELVLLLARQLASQPDKVAVTESSEGGIVELRLTAAEEDKGRLIGKQGKVIKAIRTVVSAAAAKDNRKAVVSVD